MQSALIAGALVALALGLATAAMADGPPVSGGDLAVEACLAAVRAEVHDGQLVVLSKDYSEANSAVLIAVAADQTPWRCLVSNDGVVAELQRAD